MWEAPKEQRVVLPVHQSALASSDTRTMSVTPEEERYCLLPPRSHARVVADRWILFSLFLSGPLSLDLVSSWQD